ncbi:MAG TPA: hypothetical protein VGV35_00430, partial [Bryobacteraceae bacterium]|nr:hypothetical protein [Bryobacteraceae bacterium]
MMKSFLAFLTLAALACAQPALAPPQIGFIQDAANALRPLLGIAGNFLLGDATQTDVNSAAFSGSFGMVNTNSALLVIDRQGNVIASADSSSGSALFAFTPSGAPAFAYLVDANAWMVWDGQSFQPASFDLSQFGSATVLSITSLRDGEAALILQRDDGLWDVRVSMATAEVTSQTAITGVTAPALALATGDLVYRDADGVVVRKPDGSEKHIAAQLPANLVFQQMGDGWIQLRDLDTLA